MKPRLNPVDAFLPVHGFNTTGPLHTVACLTEGRRYYATLFRY
jgi:hypothetical protein